MRCDDDRRLLAYVRQQGVLEPRAAQRAVQREPVVLRIRVVHRVLHETAAHAHAGVIASEQRGASLARTFRAVRSWPFEAMMTAATAARCPSGHDCRRVWWCSCVWAHKHKQSNVKHACVWHSTARAFHQHLTHAIQVRSSPMPMEQKGSQRTIPVRPAAPHHDA